MTNSVDGIREMVENVPLATSAQESGLITCATDWAGMSSSDLPTLASQVIPNLSNFSMLTDRVQQGFVNFMFLGRLMLHPDGFSSDSAFRSDNNGTAESVIDTQRLFYHGNSQGGILGGALTAVAPDFQRAALGVPGMNFSTLLDRSTAFDPFRKALYRNYELGPERPLVMALIQQQWDRAEANGYAAHMTDAPYPNTPSHKVLLLEAFGDHQVSNVTTQVEARTIGAQLRTPSLDPGRPGVWGDYFWGIRSVPSLPYDGSVVALTYPAGAGNPTTSRSAVGRSISPSSSSGPLINAEKSIAFGEGAPIQNRHKLPAMWAKSARRSCPISAFAAATTSRSNFTSSRGS